MAGISDAFVMIDRDWRLTYVNARAVEFSGMSAGRMVGASIWDLFPGISGSALEAALRLAAERGISRKIEDYHAPLDRWFEHRIHPVPGGLTIFSSDVTDRKLAREALETSEAHFRAVFDLAAAGFAQIDAATGFFVRANRRFCEITGYEEAELVGKTSADITHPDDVARDRDILTPALRGDVDAWEIEKRYIRKDGRTAWVFIAGRLLRDAAGRPFRTLTNVIDMTERKRTEGYLSAVLSSIDDHLASYDRDWRFTFVNDGAAQILGRPREELIGRNIWELFPDAVGNPYYRDVHEAMESQKVVRSEHYYQPLDRWFENFIYPSSEGVTVFASDITFRKNAQLEIEASRLALKENEQRLRLVVESMQLGIWEYDAVTRELKADRRCRELFALPPEARLDDALMMAAVYPEDRAAFQAAWTRSHDPGVGDFEVDCRTLGVAGAAARWVHARGRTFFDEAGAPLRSIGTFMDITPRKESEEALQQADRRKDEFLATLAHELRNPLAPIRNSLLNLRLGSGSLDPMHEMMERQVNHMVRLVDDLMEVSRITRGKIELRRERIDLETVLQSAIETSRPLIADAGQNLVVTLPPDPVILDADPVRLAQVFANLLNNASKYTDPGGRIDLAARRENGGVAVSVRDSGIGIPADMLPRVFDLFTQIDHTLGRSHGGLGIGLALVRRLVEMHGGRVRVRSDGPGTGSEFLVRLPLVTAAAPHDIASPSADRLPASPPTRRILIVDDNRDAAESLGLLLRLLGAETAVVNDGVSAVERVRSFHPDLVLLDLGMPGMDGHEVARRIRADNGNSSVLLIALTGWGQPEDRRRSREAGFDHHLVKPVDFEALQSLLRSIEVQREPEPS